MSIPAVIWLDMQLPPRLCEPVAEMCGIPAEHLIALGMEQTPDELVFEAGRKANATIVTKDSDFIQLLDRLGPPPAIVWLRCGNCSTATLLELLARFLPEALSIIRAGDALVEISFPMPGSTGQA